MAEGFCEFQSSEESEVPSVASADKGKSDEELQSHLLRQEDSIATSDNGTHTVQPQDTIENLSSFNGEHEHSRLVDAAYSTSDPESDENNRELLSPGCYDKLVGHVATSSHHACQEMVDAQQEKLQLELELGRSLFLKDKQKRNERVYLSSRTHANEQSKSCSASGATYDFTVTEEKPFGGVGLPQEPDSAFCMEDTPEYEPRSHSTNPKILDRKTEVFPSRDLDLDTPPENQGQEGDLLEDQGALQTESIEDAEPSNNKSDPESESTCNEEDLSATVSDDTVLGLIATAAPECQDQIDPLENAAQELKKETSSRSDMADLPGANAVCDDSSTRLSAHRHFNTGVVTHVPLEPSQVDEVQGIDAVFLAQHSQDPHLCESLQANVLEARPNMVSSSEPPLVNEVQGIDAIFLTRHSLDPDLCESPQANVQNPSLLEAGPNMVSSSELLLVNEVQGIDAIFLTRHSLDPDLCESPQANVQNPSLLEAGPNMVSSSEDPVSRQWIRSPCLVPSENDCICCENDGSQACSAYGTIMPERCRPDSGHDECCVQCLEVSSSEDQVSRQWIRNPCLVPSENDCVCCENDGSQACSAYGTIMPERCRPDSGHDECCVQCLEVSSSEDQVSRQWIRNPCLVPSENDCVCCENDGSQACGAYGTIMPERCRPDSGHDECCECLEDVFSRSLILPCSHRVHMERNVDVILNGQLTCPICGRTYLLEGLKAKWAGLSSRTDD